ncbi:hypothetical protein [Halomarina oriensis]|uniref:Uncharacterized protein n=1 Tax=Halomarina oriensis TaxID=671145 RepID=A0A6B0GNE3_9EURY|nr:hypothetical protein [Halomarina oriensis]MWG36200.1 hypothetical protein [Halomarina oriensis]
MTEPAAAFHHDSTSVRFTNAIESYMTDAQRDRADALAHVHGTTRSALTRHFYDSTYTETFGLIDPTFVRDDLLPADVLDGLLAGDLDWQDVDETFYITDATYVETDLDELATPSTPTPEFHRTVGSADLARPGLTLEWDDLKTIVENHDFDDPTTAALEIHPDRVEPGTLKRRKKTSGQALAAMARVAADDGVVTRGELIDLVLKQLSPGNERHDEVAGKDYLVKEWVPVVGDYLYESPDGSEFFTTFTALNAHINDAVEYGLEQATVDDDTMTLLSVGDWLEAIDWSGSRAEGEQQWEKQVAQWLDDVVEFYQTAQAFPELVRCLDIPVDDRYDDAHDMCVEEASIAYRIAIRKLDQRRAGVIDETYPGNEEARRDLAEAALSE